MHIRVGTVDGLLAVPGRDKRTLQSAEYHAIFNVLWQFSWLPENLTSRRYISKFCPSHKFQVSNKRRHNLINAHAVMGMPAHAERYPDAK